MFSEPAPAVAIEPTPEGLLQFWLGPLRDVAGATEESWRNRMLRWRVGVFARAFEDIEFAAAQRELCEQLHERGERSFFAPEERWATPHGWLAKLIVFDQFPRSVHRGTPLAYAADERLAAMIRHICAQGWDLHEYNLIERLWVYIALSHPEDRDLQELSVAKWMRWSADLVAASSPEQRRVHQRVGWAFVKAVIEHSEAVLLHGKFPHRNPVLCRPHRPGEIHYLTNELRPMWSFTQPPRPDYYALHAALPASDRYLDCRAIRRDALHKFHQSLGLDPDVPTRSLMDVFEVVGTDRVGFHDLYRHAMLSRNTSLYEAVVASPTFVPHLRQVKKAIFEDEDASWPPRSARVSVPRVIDVAALNAATRCPLLDRGLVCVPRAAIDAFVERTGFRSCPFAHLHERYKAVLADANPSYEMTRDSTRRSVPIGPRAFERIAGALFEPSPARQAAVTMLYELLDLDYDGTVDAAETLVALVALCSGGVEDKLRVVFQVFDGDCSGHLDRVELHDLVHTTLLRGLHVVEALFRDYTPPSTRESTEVVVLFSLANYSAVEEGAERALFEADTDANGLLDEAEFTAWAKTHPHFSQLLTLSRVLFGA